ARAIPRTRRYGMSDGRYRDHSGLMFANLITLPHLSVSSAISFLNSAGEASSGVVARVANRGGDLEAAGFHHACRWRSGNLAACDRRAGRKTLSKFAGDDRARG